jgi:hypothetical protein
VNVIETEGWGVGVGVGVEFGVAVVFTTTIVVGTEVGTVVTTVVGTGVGVGVGVTTGAGSDVQPARRIPINRIARTTSNFFMHLFLLFRYISIFN